MTTLMSSFSPEYGHHSSEPMTMGSPASPQSPAHHAAYLPGYLLGDSMSHAVSPVSSRMWSGSAGGGSPPRSSHRGSHITSPNTSLHHTVSTPRMDSSLRSKDKIGAPPVKSLLQSTSPSQSVYNTPYNQSQFPSRRAGLSSPAPPTLGLSQSMHESVYYSPEQPSFTSSSASRIPTSPAQLDPFYTQGESLTTEDVLDGTWVTVFGFPPAAASFVLQQFSQYGNIVKHVISSEGNWMHIHYQSKIQAKKALSKNGKVIGNSIMVGVSPCIDKKVMEGENDSLGNVVQFGTPDTGGMAGSTSTPGGSKARGTPIRPLTAAYMAAKSEHEVIQNSQAPKKNTGLINKAMEYVFGW